MNLTYISRLKKIDLFGLLILFIPHSIILGNYVLNLNIAIVILFGIYKYYKKISKESNLYKYQILLLLILLVINIFLSQSPLITLKGVLGLIKHLFLFLFLYFWLSENKSNFILFLLSTSFGILLVSSSVIFELVYNILNQISYDRLSGFFYEEKIAGSYITKLLFFVFLFLFLEKKKKYFFLIFSFVMISVLLTGDRTPIFMSIISTSFVLFLDHKLNFKKKTKFIFIFLIILSSVFVLSNNLKLKLLYTSEQLGFSATSRVLYYINNNIFNIYDKKENFEDYTKRRNNNVEQSFFNTKWSAHFAQAYEIGKNNLIFGSGIKSFRYECSNKKYTNNFLKKFDYNYSCSTHPHNIYFEIFSETGLSGLTIFIYIIIKTLKNILTITSRRIRNFLLGSMIILFFPFQPTGSFFSTFNGIFYFLNLSLSFYLFKNYKSFK